MVHVPGAEPHVPESRPRLILARQSDRVKFRIMIPHDLLEILVCPACKKPLLYRMEPESLKCTECRRVYPVKDDIPVLLVEEATIDAV
jgi:uncharacterized protein YbaR (Trm112 family)